MAVLTVLWLCVILFLISVATESGFDFSSYPLSVIDAGSKNAGVLVSEEVEFGPIRMGPTGDSKGSHLAIAYSGLSELQDQPPKLDLLKTIVDKPATSELLKNADDTGMGAISSLLGEKLGYFNGTVIGEEANVPLRIYPIYYGSWSQFDIGIIKSFLLSLKPPETETEADLSKRYVRNWWRVIRSNYYDQVSRPITKIVTAYENHLDKRSCYPRGTSSNPLSDRDIRNIVARYITARFIAKNISRSVNDVFLVLTDKDTYVNDYCQGSCSYHSAFRFGGQNVAYAHIGNPETQCPDRCSYRYLNASYVPTNGLGVDAVINWVAHEVVGLATNPYQFLQRGNPGWIVENTAIELADLCEWDFGYVSDVGGHHNLEGETYKFLVQRNWDRRDKRCTAIGHGTVDTPITST